MIDTVARVYTYRNESAVLPYLQQHPQVVPALIEASRLIPLYFGPSSPLTLEVVTDPEEPGVQSLFALIQTRLEPDEALPLLDEFNDRWWRPTSSAVDADLHFGLDYVCAVRDEPEAPSNRRRLLAADAGATAAFHDARHTALFRWDPAPAPETPILNSESRILNGIRPAATPRP